MSVPDRGRPNRDEAVVYYHLAEDGVAGPISKAEAVELLGKQFLNEFAFDLDGRLVVLEDEEEIS